MTSVCHSSLPRCRLGSSNRAHRTTRVGDGLRVSHPPHAAFPPSAFPPQRILAARQHCQNHGSGTAKPPFPPALLPFPPSSLLPFPPSSLPPFLSPSLPPALPSSLPPFLQITLSHGRVKEPAVRRSFTELLQLLGDMLLIGMPWKLCGLPRASSTPRLTAFSSRAVGPSVRNNSYSLGWGGSHVAGGGWGRAEGGGSVLNCFLL